MDNIVHGIPHDEIEKFLINLNLLDKIENEKVKCVVCFKILNIDNIGLIYPTENEILFSCDDLICIQQMSELFAPLRRVTGDSYDEA